ncbi:hypothetical protein GCM10019059_15940 [Camelimonas fluminis]|nr:hypothetical protein GCM10019059_15940 [Camelimonas fluminis]
MEQKVNKHPVHASVCDTVAARAKLGKANRPRQASQPGGAGREDGTGRLLARLAVSGAFLTPSVDGRDAWSIGFTGARRLANGGGVSLGGGAVDGAMVRGLLTAGALEREAGAARQRLVLSQAGRARLRRAGAAVQGPDGDPWRAQHADLGHEERRVDGEMQRVRVNHAESPLAWLRRRRDRSGEAMIDEAAFAAGERLRADMTRAQMTPRVTASWETPVSAGNGGRLRQEPGDMAMAARQRVSRALAAAGDEFAGVLVDVCGFLKGLEQVEKERAWPARSGKLILRMALARLAAHYGLAAARGPERASTRAWRG